MARFSVHRLTRDLRAAGQRAREVAPEVARRVVNPRSLERFEGVERFAQLIALAFLPFVIVVTFQVLRIFNGIMATVLAGSDYSTSGDYADIAGWLVTAITLGGLIVCAWGWFQFVRTAGFGYFSWGDP